MSDALVAKRPPPLLSVEGLTKHFNSGGHARSPAVTAVDDVSFTVGEGETVCLVGESGSGKSTIARMVLGLTAPSSGHIVFQGTELPARLGGRRDLTRRQMQAVFQDPRSSLNQQLSVRTIVREPLLRQVSVGKDAREDAVLRALEEVGLGALASRRGRQLSGGQAQRVAIARALVAQPRLVVLDEPLSSLDLSVQAQVVNILEELREKRGVAYLLISHDLDVVRHIAHHVIVMSKGKVVESKPCEQLFATPEHPYTRQLLASSLALDVDEPARYETGESSSPDGEAGGESRAQSVNSI